MANSRPQKSLYSKGITSYGTPVADNVLNINLDLPKIPVVQNQLENAKYVAPTQEVKPLNDEYKPVPQVSSLPLDKSALDRNEHKVVKKDPVVHKHVYVHIPPPEDDEYKKNGPLAPQVQKHYKIIFIKTPTEKTPLYNNLQISQNEEKTLIYVLYKKPEDQELPVLSSITPPINKPEVYYINYKTKLNGKNSGLNNSVGSYNNFPDTYNTVSTPDIVNAGISVDPNSFGGYPENKFSNKNGVVQNSFELNNEQETTTKFDKVGKITDLISGGSISDALLGAGTLPGNLMNEESTTQETITTTELLQTSYDKIEPRVYKK